MALGPSPKLSEIKTELESSSSNLVSFISQAGKTGIWDRQSQFAGYSNKYLSINPELMSFQGDGTPYGTNICDVSSNMSYWDAIEDDLWVFATPDNGSGNGSFQVICNSNPDTLNPRNTFITVSGEGGLIERILYINQDTGEPV